MPETMKGNLFSNASLHHPLCQFQIVLSGIFKALKDLQVWRLSFSHLLVCLLGNG